MSRSTRRPTAMARRWPALSRTTRFPVLFRGFCLQGLRKQNWINCKSRSTKRLRVPCGPPPRRLGLTRAAHIPISRTREVADGSREVIRLTYAQAACAALERAMAADARVVALGEDVGR